MIGPKLKPVDVLDRLCKHLDTDRILWPEYFRKVDALKNYTPERAEPN